MTDSGSSEPTGSPLSSRSTSLFGWSSRLKEIHVGPRTVPCAVVKFDRPAAFAESLIRLRVNLARALPDYLRLYLTSRQGSAALAAAATGSVISNLRRDALQEVEIHLPDLETQRMIVEIMSSVEMQLGEVSATLKTFQDLYDTSSEGFAAGAFAPNRETEQGEGS